MTKNTRINNTPVYVAEPGGEIKGGLIIIHEVWGLNDHIKNVSDRYAAQGYRVYAPDLLVGTGIEEQVTPQLQQDLFNPERRNAIQPKLRELMAPIQSPDFALKTVDSLKNIFNDLYLNPDVQQNVAVLGFCFGGTYSYNLAVAEPRLKAALPFYGHCDQDESQLSQIECPIMAFYGENDQNLVSSLPELEAKMHQAQVEFSYKLYPKCGHAFFNDTNPYAYNEAAAKDAWIISNEFLTSKMVS